MARLSEDETFNTDPCLSLFNVLTKSTDKLNKLLIFFMNKAAERVKNIEPVIDHIHRKVADYRSQRPYDTVTVVGSVGNELYYPEKMSDGTYLVEVDVLYNREMPNVVLPIYTPPAESEILYIREGSQSIINTIKPPVITVKMDFMNDRTEEHIVTLPIGTCLLQVIKIIDEVSKEQKWKFFKVLKNDKTYMPSLSFTLLIPRQEDPCILGETEIEPLEKVFMLPLYRTCRTNIETMNIDGKIIRYIILMDKVSAIKGPWPYDISDFQTREKKWPEKSLVESIVQDGCLLTHKTSLNVYPLQWKMTFSLAEQQLTTHFTFSQKYLFILLKLVKKKYLDMGVMENGESRDGLTTYHLKTIYLWMCETHIPEEFEKYPAMGFMSFLSSLKQCIASKICPNYFIPKINVMERFGRFKKPLTKNDENWLRDQGSVHSALVQQIDCIMNDPEKFLTEDLFDVIDEKHLYDLQKTIGETT